MAVFTEKDADRYGGGSGNYFSLKNDKDTAQVRFLYEGIGDVQGMSVHPIKTEGNDWEQTVNCLRKYNDPMDVCPLCAAGYALKAKLYIPVLDVETQEVKIWERGKNFFSKLSSLCTRYKPLCGTIFEIERVGKAGDMKTTYETYPISNDDSTLEDLPEAPIVLGTKVLDKTAAEMQYFLEYGEFPAAGEIEEEIPEDNAPFPVDEEEEQLLEPPTRAAKTQRPPMQQTRAKEERPAPAAAKMGSLPGRNREVASAEREPARRRPQETSRKDRF